MTSTSARPVELRRVVNLWLPLAASWLLMGVELPLLTAVIARMRDPEVQLAAFGSIAFPVSLVIEGPIIMLLAASTALCTTWQAYRHVLRFAHAAGAALTVVHGLVAFTPLYDVIAVDVLGALPEVVEPGRLGLQIMLPWSWAIAYRRFQQGVLIRNEASHAVTVGTLLRLTVNATTLFVGWRLGAFQGVAVASAGLAAGVTVEALYAAWRVRPVLEKLRRAPAADEPLTTARFLRFYLPLALLPFVTLVVQPAAAAAMNRMPRALPSVAAWPAVHGLVFITRSVGFAYNEVVVTLIGLPGSVATLRRFHRMLIGATMGILALLAATPLAGLWFERVSGLSPELGQLARVGVAFAILMPGYQVLQSFYQGALVKNGKTRAVTEAVVLYCVLCVTLLSVGVQWQPLPGLHYALIVFAVSGLAQTGWLRWRSRDVIQRYADGV